MRRLGANDVGAAVTAALSILYLILNREYSAVAEDGLSSGFFPNLVGIATLALSLVWLISNQMSKTDFTWRELVPRSGPVFILLLTIVWSILFEYLGVILSLILLTAGIWIGYEKKPWGFSLIAAFVLSLTIYSIFHLILGVPLPGGWLKIG